MTKMAQSEKVLESPLPPMQRLQLAQWQEAVAGPARGQAAGAGYMEGEACTVSRSRREREVLGWRGAAQGHTGAGQVDLGAAAGVGADLVVLVEV